MKDIIATIRVTKLTLREGPDVSYPRVGYKYYGDKVIISGLKNKFGGVNVWANVDGGWLAYSYMRQSYIKLDYPVEVSAPEVNWPIPNDNTGRDWPRYAGAQWIDSSGFMTRFGTGYHPGADLNLNKYGYWDMDAHMPVFSIADGQVIYSGLVVGSTWGNITVINHGYITYNESVSVPMYSRYGHLEKSVVKAGDLVKRGQAIGQIGKYVPFYGDGNYHLHHDISFTDILSKDAKHWPGSSYDSTATNYYDPLKFYKEVI